MGKSYRAKAVEYAARIHHGDTLGVSFKMASIRSAVDSTA